MRTCGLALVVGVALFAACGGGDDRSPRERCLETETAINAAAQECDPQYGTVDLSCDNFGTGDSCGVIDDYFDCLAQVTCDGGTVVLATDCQLGACE